MSTTGGTLKSTTNEQRKEERNKALLSQGQNNIGHIIQFFFDRPHTDVRGGLPDKPFVGVYNSKKSTPKLVYSRQFARS